MRKYCDLRINFVILTNLHIFSSLQREKMFSEMQSAWAPRLRLIGSMNYNHIRHLRVYVHKHPSSNNRSPSQKVPKTKLSFSRGRLKLFWLNSENLWRISFEIKLHVWIFGHALYPFPPPPPNMKCQFIENGQTDPH